MEVEIFKFGSFAIGIFGLIVLLGYGGSYTLFGERRNIQELSGLIYEKKLMRLSLSFT